MMVIIGTLGVAMRALVRAPRFSVMAVLPLGAAIGAVAAVLAIVQAVLLAPLPYRSAEELVRILRVSNNGVEPFQSGPDLLEWKERITGLSGIAGFAGFDAILIVNGEPTSLQTVQVSDGFFEVLAARPRIGRFFDIAENEPDRSEVVVLSHSLWLTAFGGDEDVIGSTVVLDGERVSVVGVAEPGFVYPAGTALWRPLPYGPRIRDDRYRGGRFLEVIARLRTAGSEEQAERELAALFADIETRFRGTGQPMVVPLHDYIAGAADRPLRLILIGVVFVLLIAAVNVANLLLARGAARQGELAVRRALGASRRQVFGLLIAEGFVVAICAVLLGVLIATGAWRVLEMLAAMAVPRLGDVRLQPSILLWAAAGCTAVVVGISGIPALIGSRVGAARTLGSASRGSKSEGAAVRRALVAVEVALSLTLLTGAGLTLRSFARLSAVDSGFLASKQIVAGDISLRNPRYQVPGVTESFVVALDEAVRAVPGVSSAAVASALPLEGTGNRMTFSIAGRPPADPAASPLMTIVAVTGGYFSVMDIPVLKGGSFTNADAGGPQVAIVSASAEDRYFGGNAIGETVVLSRRGVSARVIGVVADVKTEGLHVAPEPHLYLPLTQFPMGKLTVLTRSASPGRESLEEEMETAVRTIDPQLALSNLRTTGAMLDAVLARPRLVMRLLLGAAALAVVLTASGILGVVTYQVAQRSREMAIRAALGATPVTLLRETTLPAARMVFLGSLAGVAGSILVGRVLAALLFAVGPMDPWALAGALAVSMLVSAFAILAPSSVIVQSDPAASLRNL